MGERPRAGHHDRSAPGRIEGLFAGNSGICVNELRNGAKLGLGTVAIAAVAASLLSGCSNIGFPAIHDMPTPRADTPLTPEQVKEATQDLISQREHLSEETQGAGKPSAEAADDDDEDEPSKATKSAPKAGSQRKSSSSAQATAPQPLVTGSTAAAYAKP